MKETQYKKSCEKFDLKTCKWEDIASLNEARQGAAAAVVIDVVYVFGGWPARNDIELYDPVANKWTVLSESMPVGRYSFAVACVNSSIYILGGRKTRNVPMESTGYWKLIPRKWNEAPLPIACSDLTAATCSVSDEVLYKVLLNLL